MASIIQWNLRGVIPQRPGLEQIISVQNPCVVALQETKLPNGKKISGFTNYEQYHCWYTDGVIACGGAALMARRDLIQDEIPLNTNLQAVAIRVTLYGKALSIVSLYLPPGTPRNSLYQDLVSLFAQIPAPILCAGDMNAHNPLWGGCSRNRRGEIIERLLNEKDLFLFNSTKHTYICPNHIIY